VCPADAIAGSEELLRDADVAMYQPKAPGHRPDRAAHAAGPEARPRRLVGVRRVAAGVFTTCGSSHITAGVTTPVELHTLMFDLPGVPAAAYFLWVVHRLNRSSLNDRNRRPLVGRAAAHGRPALRSAA
jgi:hypothetical protein